MVNAPHLMAVRRAVSFLAFHGYFVVSAALGPGMCVRNSDTPYLARLWLPLP